METNLHWPLLDPTMSWEERMQGIWESNNADHNVTYNTTDDTNQEWQPGGCIQISTERTSHRKISSGQDTTGLGRWCWTRYRGRHDVTIRVITCYRPCSGNNQGENTVHSQQKHYFDSINNNRTPRQALLDDLCAAISLYKESGDQIVLMMDANEDVTSNHIKNTFQAIGPKEAITDRHSDTPNIPTYQRGSTPIDGIFLSSTLQLKTGGYLPFGAFPTDHRFIWTKIKFSNAFGYKMPPLVPPDARRLKTIDPDCVKRFLEYYEQFIIDNNLHLAAFELQEELLQSPMTPQMLRRYNHLQDMRHKGLKAAERQCRKLKMGGIPWSRTLQLAMDTICLWKAVLSRKQGTRVSTRFITRLEKQVNIRNSPHCSLIKASDNLHEAYKKYYALKKDADQLRETWLRDLAAIKARDEGGDQEAIYQSMLLRERQHTAGRRLRRVTGKLQKGLTKVSVTEGDSTAEVTSKSGIDYACYLENKAKYSQTNATPPMTGTTS